MPAVAAAPIPTALVREPALGTLLFHPVVCLACGRPLSAEGRASCRGRLCPLRGALPHFEGGNP